MDPGYSVCKTPEVMRLCPHKFVTYSNRLKRASFCCFELTEEACLWNYCTRQLALRWLLFCALECEERMQSFDSNTAKV